MQDSQTRTPISAHGTLSEPDLLPAAKYGLWHRVRGMKIMVAIGWLMMFVVVANLTVGEPANALGPLILGVFWIGYPLAAPRFSIRRQFKDAKHLSEPGVYQFDERQFTITQPSLTIAMVWSSLHSVVELNDSFALFTTRRCFLVVPKRFFPAEEVAAFRELLRQVLRANGKELVVHPRRTAK